MIEKNCECCILGAGPAGLAVSLELTSNNVNDIIIVDKHKIPGGLSRTEIFDSVRFDVGPHRFFTKNAEVDKIWHDSLGSDFKPVERLTRILYGNKYFNYPIKASEALLKLGPATSLKAMLSYLLALAGEKKQPLTFEEWVVQNFGEKLYTIFFKTYTEKVWGIPCNQIGAEWAAQRIKGLDIIEVIKNALFKGKKNTVKTLVDQFNYPILGAGQMYEAMLNRSLVNSKVQVLYNNRVTAINHKDNTVTSVDIEGPSSETTKITAKHFFSSIPLTHFFKFLNPAQSDDINKAVDALYYRDHITVNILADGDDLFPDQWIYVHSPEVKMARLANYNNFSRLMVGSKNKTALSVEYFVFQSDKLWKDKDSDLVELAGDELNFMGLVNKKAIEKAWVVRETESYPTYYLGFQEPYEKLRNAVDKFTNLHAIGRGGMYKYNNQDHSIYSGLLGARNYLQSDKRYNLWNINIDCEYHEKAEIKETKQ
ncbi:protoporphyrinogen oxidase [Candidatus Magnetoovum chiemensis]|nr:protoporphyrinogen oxidase [Candidatus Magnetoovum chiemensis]